MTASSREMRSIDFPFITDGRTITEADIVNFAGFSGDFGPYHVDHTAVSAGAFGVPIMHGLGTLSILSGLMVQSRFLKTNGSDPIAFLQVDVKMTKPTFVGDTIRVRVNGIDQRVSLSHENCYVCEVDMECVNQDSKAVLQVRWVSLQRGPLLPVDESN